MADEPRIHELERDHATWRRRGRWRTVLLLLFPLLAGGGLVWANRAELQKVRDGVAQGFAQVAGQPAESVQTADLDDLLGKLASLGEEVTALRGVRDQLGAEQAQRAALEQQLGQARSSVESEKAGQQQQLAEAQAALETERAAKAALETRIAELERSAPVAAARLEQAEVEIRALRTIRDRLQAEVDGLGDRLETAEDASGGPATAGRIETAQAEIEGLRKVRDGLRVELDAAQDRLAEIEAAESERGSAAAVLATRLETTETELAGLRKIRAQLQAELDSVSDQLATLQAAPLATAAAAVSPEEALLEVTKLTERVATLETELSGMKEGNDRLRAERDEARSRVDALTRELTILQDELEAARTQRTQDEAERSKVAQRIATLEGEVERLTAERVQAQARLDELEGQLTTALARAERIGDEMIGVRASLESARVGAVDQVAATVARAGTETKAADQIETARDGVLSQLDDLTRRIEALEDELARLRQERETAVAEREALDRRLAELAAETLRLQAERDEATGRLASLERDLASARTRAIAASQDAERARSLLSASQGDVEQRLGDAIGRAQAAADEAFRLRADLGAVEAAKLALAGQLTGLEEEKRSLVDAGATLAELAAPIDLLRGQLAAAPMLASAGDLDRVVLDRAALLQRVLAAAPGTDDADYLNGDPMTVPSAVLFDLGSARLKPEGRPRLVSLANRLKDTTAILPDDLPWIIRVDGHTDSLPVRGGRFSSNLELSTARALAVASFLVDQGVPAERVVPAGFADHVPVVAESDEATRALNRRIEIKLGLR